MSEQEDREDDHERVERIAGRPRSHTNPANSYPVANHSQRSKILKIALGFSVLFLVLFFLAPGDKIKST